MNEHVSEQVIENYPCLFQHNYSYRDGFRGSREGPELLIATGLPFVLHVHDGIPVDGLTSILNEKFVCL